MKRSIYAKTSKPHSSAQKSKYTHLCQFVTGIVPLTKIHAPPLSQHLLVLMTKPERLIWTASTAVGTERSVSPDIWPNLHLMDLRQLRYFQVVAAALNFSRAAERLHVAQPALSRQIRDLEDEIGVTLLRRSTSRVRLIEVATTKRHL